MTCPDPTDALAVVSSSGKRQLTGELEWLVPVERRVKLASILG
jgi:hypothetical protein